ncbi:MAG: cephalosporin hydroxylase family protein [Spirochaetia bacterium]
MNPIDEFKHEVKENIKRMGEDARIQKAGKNFLDHSVVHKYSYNFSWMGRPIIQYPQDILAMQEIIWQVKPDLIIETGIAHGGSLIFYASMLELIGHGHILGIDIDIRAHNRQEIEQHPMFKRITMIQGSSIAEDVVSQVHDFAKNHQKIMVVLDSNHTHDHVLQELEAYAPLVTSGSYCVVFDTLVEDIKVPDEYPEVKSMTPDRPWCVGDNPKTAVVEFLKAHGEFSIDKEIDHKLIISVAPSGYLRRA